MSLEFDGATQYIQIAQTKDLPIYNDTSYSVCGWVKAPAQDDKRIFAEGSTASKNPLFVIGSGRVSESLQSKLRVYIRNDASTTLLGADGSYVASTTTLFDDTWHHFCWVDNNGDADLYIDGTLDATNFNYTRSGTFTFNRTGIAAIIRAEVSYWLDGELFDIRCYNRCLSANEIAEIYHKRGADRVWQGLVGWWRLDELPSGTPAPVLLDAMDATTDWSATNGTVSLNTTTYQEGTGALNVYKTSTGTNVIYCKKTLISPVNLTGKQINTWFYIKDQTALSKISRAEIWLESISSNNYRYHFESLAVGWNELIFSVVDYDAIQGTPNIASIAFILLVYRTNNNADVHSAGDTIFDYCRASDYYPFSIPDLSGYGNHGTPYGGPTYQSSPHRLRRGVLVS